MAAGSLNENRGGHAIIPMRYIMSIMGCIGMAIIYGFKVNVSVAMVAMVNETAIKLLPKDHSTIINPSLNSSFHPSVNSTLNTIFNATSVSGTLHELSKSSKTDGPFVWSRPLQGLIKSSYFWGYMVSLIPAGRMSELLSAKWVMNVSVLLNVVASVLSPVAAQMHYSFFIAMRFIQGIGGGVTFPAMHVMVSKWAPPNERSVLTSIVYAGTALGTVISLILTGILADNFGWASVFYIEGALCLIWCTAWWLMVEDSPDKQKRFITSEEREYILSSLNKSVGKSSHGAGVPWRKVFTSPPFLAILVAHFCSNVGWYMLLTELPHYMNQMLEFNLSENAGLSALPFFCMWIFTMGLSKILAIMQEKNWISVTVSRKIGTLFASAVPMLCLIGVSYVGKDRFLAVTLMTIGGTCLGGMYCGFLANHIDIAPNYAGTLVSITNFFATIPGLTISVIVGKLTDGNETVEAWRVVFFITVIFYIVEMLVYTMFGTGEEQPWNRVDEVGVNVEEATDQKVHLKEHREL
ncbi:sialin [Leptopilina heterotoma]|uniref:sialin n=1 Tax=Leptopilina heterotoma TaxID=63436 RepID=UPI001CA7D903|nr:sialin [Leptopilina heterotoma]